MDWFSKVVWSEGMFLRPQHFQQHERDIERYVHNRTDGLNAYEYGFKSLELDPDLLPLGKVSIISAEGLMPDGTPFRIPSDTPAPPPLEPGANSQGFVAALALPAKRVGAGDVIIDAENDGATRYAVRRVGVRDSSLRDSIDAEIDIANLDFRLMRDDDNKGGFVTMNLARILEVRADGGLIVDTSFLPPVLNCQTFRELKGHVSGMHGLLRQRGENLASTLGEIGRSGAAELWEFMLLQIINRYEPLMQHLSVRPVLHPEALYQILVQLLGEFAMLTRESKRPGDIPPYRHDAPHETFEPLVLEIRRSVSREAEPNAVWIDIEDRGNFLHCAKFLDRELLLNAGLVLAIKSNMSPGEIMNRIKEVKLVSEKRISTIGGLSGIELLAQTAKPKEIPHHAGFLYFELNRQGNPLQKEIWSQIQDSSAIWIYDSGRFAGLEMELWAIKQQS